MNENQKKYYNPSTILVVAIIAFLFVSSVTIFSFNNCMNEIKIMQKENIVQFEKMVESIKIYNKNDKFDLKINKESYEKIDTITDTKYNNFLIQYNEIQANWLNIWLTILGLALAFLGLIVPICFMKLYEDKKNEMDKVIDETKKQKKQAQVNVDKIEKKMEEINKKSEDLSSELSSAKKYVEQITKDIVEVKKYVNKAKAMSKYTEALGKMNKGEKELIEAQELFTESYSLYPNDDKILEAMSIHVYYKRRMYDRAIEFMINAIQINKSPHYYYELSYIQEKKKDYINAIESIKTAILLSTEEYIKKIYNSQLAIYFAKNKEKESALNILNDLSSNRIKIPDIESKMAVAYIFLDEYQKAINILERNLKNRSDVFDYYNITEAYIRNKEFEKALNALKEYVNIKTHVNKELCNLTNEDYKNWMDVLANTDANNTVQEIIKILNNLQKEE